MDNSVQLNRSPFIRSEGSYIPFFCLLEAGFLRPGILIVSTLLVDEAEDLV
jgi:hypothetical protein